MDRQLWESFARRGVKSLTAVLRDGAPSSFQSFGLGVTATVAGAPKEQGLNIIGIESERFRLSALPSVFGFPFDDVQAGAVVYLLADNGAAEEFTLEVKKTLPGRILRASMRNRLPWMALTRSATEKGMVVAGATVFFLVCLVVAIKLFASRAVLSGLQEVLAFAGFLVAAGEFRNVLGLSRATGTSALEVAILGIPLMLIAAGLVVSTIHGLRAEDPRHPKS